MEFNVENFSIWVIIGTFLGYGIYLLRFFQVKSYFLTTLLIFVSIATPIGALIGFYCGKFFLEDMGITKDNIFEE